VAVAISRQAEPAVSAPPLSLLVLAAGRGSCIGVDLERGGFVFARWPERSLAAAHAFDVVLVEPAREQEVPDPARPEAVDVMRPPRKVGRLRGRVAERYLKPLLLPAGHHLLGLPGTTAPYWTLSGHTPSLCLVQPPVLPVVVRRATGTACRFVWRQVEHELALADSSLGDDLARTGRSQLGGAALADLLGYMPTRLLVALTAPRDGYCSKVVAGLLPRR
jgi:hypothetical protein